MLSTNVKVTLETLKPKLKDYLKQYNKTSYKKEFPWLDNIFEVRDKAVIKKLFDKVIEDIYNNKIDFTWLAIPEIIDWSDVLGFKFSKPERAKIYPDIELSNFIHEIKDDQGISLDYLKRRKVYLWSSSTSSAIKSWSVFQCLYAEVVEDNKTYILNNGDWYQLDNNFVDIVDKAYKSVPRSSISFLPHLNEREDRYNEKMVENDPVTFALMDKKNISYGGGKSKIEFCDLYTSKKAMVHVKKYGGSSVLSHLFSQGVVSATAFLSDEKFRSGVNDLLPASHKLSDHFSRPKSDEFKICYAILSSAPGDLVIPFFSKVSLKNAIKQLSLLGYNYSLAKIEMK